MARIAVIGPGKVGTALALAFQQAGHTVVGAYCRDTGSPGAVRFRRLLSAPTTTLTVSTPTASAVDDSTLFHAEVFLVTVPDRAVTETAQTLVDTGILAQSKTWMTTEDKARREPSLPMVPVVVHTAGSLSAEALAPVKNTGSLALAMHPLQTIAGPEQSPQCFQGITFTLDGDASAAVVATEWIHGIGGIPLNLSPELRSGYHAAAVLASNAVIALMAVAADISGLQAGVEPFLPLLQGSIDNLRRLGLPQALTGPVERGDVETVKKHLNALQDNPTALQVYRVLGGATVPLALNKGTLTPDAAEELRSLFQ